MWGCQKPQEFWKEVLAFISKLTDSVKPVDAPVHPQGFSGKLITIFLLQAKHVALKWKDILGPHSNKWLLRDVQQSGVRKTDLYNKRSREHTNTLTSTRHQLNTLSS